MLIVKAKGKVTDLVTKSVCLGCIRAKGCGLSVEVVHNHRVQSNERHHNFNKSRPKVTTTKRHIYTP